MSRHLLPIWGGAHARRLLPALTIGFCGMTAVASAEPLVVDEEVTLNYHQRDFGGVGLLQMPTARMMPAGNLAFFIGRVDQYTRGGVSIQPYDWLEGLFRYTDIANVLYGPSIAGSQSYKDKGVDFKIRLWDETYYRPQVALGFQDFGGTGLFSSEYLVGSKQWGDFDFTLGMAWGYLGQGGGLTNPATWVSDRFEERSGDTTAGDFSLGNLFSGDEVGVFGGVEYRPKHWPLTFQLEYDGNDYSQEPKGQRYEQDSRFNFGMVYSWSPGLDLKLGFERGNQVMFGLVLQTNFESAQQAKVLDPDPEPITGTEGGAPGTTDWPYVAERLRNDAGWRVDSVRRQAYEVRIEGEQATYMNRAKSVGRASRILANILEPDIEWFTFVESTPAGAVNQISVNRAAMTAAADYRITPKEMARAGAGVAVSRPEMGGRQVYGADVQRLNYGVTPHLQQTLGGPDGFMLYQLTANANMTYRVLPKTWLSGGLELGLVDNYDQFVYDAPSKLPRVRTYIREYLTTSKLRMSNLQLTHFDHLAEDWYSQVYGGYLESMYAGVGGEVLYRPYGERWAVGLDMNYVKQRDFDMKFGLRNYSTVTGHGSLYYDLPWMENTLAKVSVGRYLAKDIGATFDLSRQFQNGLRYGAWATFTDVSSEEFGEGSFDKGFYVAIPFDSFFVRSSKRRANFTWNFLTRDGGQRLGRRYSLYDMTQARDIDSFYRGFNEIIH